MVFFKQIIELDEIHFLQNLCQLSKLNLKKNPIQVNEI